MAFCDHLRADKNVNLPVSKSAEDTLEVAYMAHRVSIDAADTRIGINLFQFSLEPLGSFTHVMDVLAVAFGTSWLRTSSKATVMAHELVDSAVIGQRDTAGTAL